MKEHLLIKDVTNGKYEYLGYLSYPSVSLIEKNVIEMMKELGRMIQVGGLDREPHKSERILPGFEWEDGLYRSLLNELELKTGKTPKRW